MKAIRVHRYGGPEVLEWQDVAEPQPGPAEYLIRVEAAGVIATDLWIRQGFMDGFLGIHVPYTPGWDFAGRVVSAGRDATDFAPGDEVFGFLPGQGSYAEYLVAAPEMLTRRPPEWPAVTAAALPLAACTAYKCLVDTPGLPASGRILITGASGGVGAFAVQLARARGLTVVAVTSPSKSEFVRSLGAAETVSIEDLERGSAITPVDLVLDSLGPMAEGALLPHLSPGGHYLRIAGDPASVATLVGRGIQAQFIGTEPNRRRLEAVREAARGWQIPVDRVFAMAEAGSAHAMLAARQVRGKVVLQTDFRPE